MATMITTRSKKRLAENLWNNFCLNKKQCYQVKKLYSGGCAGCIHFNAQEDEWWSPKKIKISDKDKDEVEKNEDTGVDDLTMFEKETLSCCIINFNHLQHALEETAVCKLCSSKQNKNILGNTVDEYSRQIERSLGICIPQDLCDDFKKRVILRDDIAQTKKLFLSQSNCGTATSLRMSCKNHHGCSVDAEKPKCCEENKKK